MPLSKPVISVWLPISTGYRATEFNKELRKESRNCAFFGKLTRLIMRLVRGYEEHEIENLDFCHSQYTNIYMTYHKE